MSTQFEILKIEGVTSSTFELIKGNWYMQNVFPKMCRCMSGTRKDFALFDVPYAVFCSGDGSITRSQKYTGDPVLWCGFRVRADEFDRHAVPMYFGRYMMMPETEDNKTWLMLPTSFTTYGFLTADAPFCDIKSNLSNYTTYTNYLLSTIQKSHDNCVAQMKI